MEELLVSYLMNMVLMIYTAEQLVPELSSFKNETAIKKLKDMNCHVLIKFWQK
jgi:hypothetical protein